VRQESMQNIRATVKELVLGGDLNVLSQAHRNAAEALLHWLQRAQCSMDVHGDFDDGSEMVGAKLWHELVTTPRGTPSRMLKTSRRAAGQLKSGKKKKKRAPRRLLTTKRCMARTWANGYGLQCTRLQSPKCGDFCFLHWRESHKRGISKHGRVDQNLPLSQVEPFANAAKRRKQYLLTPVVSAQRKALVSCNGTKGNSSSPSTLALQSDALQKWFDLRDDNALKRTRLI